MERDSVFYFVFEIDKGHKLHP